MRYHYLIRLGENFPLVIVPKLINTAQTSPSSKMSTTFIPQSRPLPNLPENQMPRKPREQRKKKRKKKIWAHIL